MRKILCIATAMLLFGCGSDDNSGASSNKAFLDITIDGQNYRDEYNEGYTASGYYENNCNGSGEVDGILSGDIETSSFSLQTYFYYFETVEEFDNRTSDTGYISRFNWSPWTNTCKRNFELSLAYEDKPEEYEYYQVASGSSHEVTSVSLYKEDSQEKTYKVEGNFEGNFIMPNGTLKPFSGSYRTFIYVLK